MPADLTALQQLSACGQSPWVDYISCRFLKSGRLASLIARGVTGLTSNPTIFQRAIASSSDYDRELFGLAVEGRSVDEIHDALVLEDIRLAANLLAPVYEETKGADGLVSIEVPPAIAYEAGQTIEEARRLWRALNLPNVMIKIPATREGVEAIRHVIAEGINVTATVLFSLDTYRAVAEAYIAGLEQRRSVSKPIDRIASVAAFYISRVDVAVDAKLRLTIAETDDDRKRAELQALQGRSAIANARVAYTAYREIFSGPRWERLARRGAAPQRCLWASTETKNPAYSDVYYVEQLIGPETANTIPPATLAAFLDHGRVERTLDRDIEGAVRTLAALEKAGISLEETARELERDTLQRFSASFNEMIDTISARRAEMLAHAGRSLGQE